MAVLDEILQVNAEATGKLPAVDQDFKAARRLCLVTCVDPRLTRFFSAALGIERGDATIIRMPGPVLGSGADLLRAVATAIFVNDCDEVLVLAHSDCGVVRTDAATLMSALRRRGVGDALASDARSFFGLAASPRQIANETSAAIRGSPLIPRDVLVHAGVLDIVTGALEIVVRGENVQVQPRLNPSRQEFAPSSGLPTLSGASSSLQDLGTRADGALPTLGGAGPSLFGDLPSGLGIGADSTRSLSAAPTAAFGPIAAAAPQMPPSPLNVTSFSMPEFSAGFSKIDLTPGVQVAPSSGLQPADAPLPTTLLGEKAPDPQPMGATPPAPPTLPRQRQGTASSQQPQTTAPRQQKPRPGPNGAGGSSPQGPKLNLTAQMKANLEKVGCFYRAEMRPEVRQGALADLEGAFQSGAPIAELIRLVFKPILESGPKRYKVIDELLAIKEGASAMDRAACYAALRQLLV
ncbi:MAG: carbonic anhydrase [Deltaproteobacteria bacterium]|nr:carbonic anhydrase [Deltaproteobacteria bacterium]